MIRILHSRSGAAAAIVVMLLASTSLAPQARALPGNSQGQPVTTMAIKAAADEMKSGAMKFVSGMGDQALEFLRDQRMGQGGKEQQFRKLLESSFDMETIARFSMGQYWRQMSPQQQKEYQSLFRNYVVKVYSSRFREYSGQGFEVKNARADSATDTIVNSIILPKQGEPVMVDWRVRYKGGNYKVVDVIVEGVSMSMTQRSDFASVIQKGGGDVGSLLSQLRQQAG